MTSPAPLDHLMHPANSVRLSAALDAAGRTLLDRLSDVCGPSTGTCPEAAAAAVGRIDLDLPLGDLDEVLAELREVWLDDAIWFHEPGYAAHLNCPVVIPAVIGETLLGAVNPSVDTFDQSVGATFVERSLVQWTAERIAAPP